MRAPPAAAQPWILEDPAETSRPCGLTHTLYVPVPLHSPSYSQGTF